MDLPNGYLRSVPTSNCIFILPRSKLGKTSLLCDVGVMHLDIPEMATEKLFETF